MYSFLLSYFLIYLAVIHIFLILDKHVHTVQLQLQDTPKVRVIDHYESKCSCTTPCLKLEKPALEVAQTTTVQHFITTVPIHFRIHVLPRFRPHRMQNMKLRYFQDGSNYAALCYHFRSELFGSHTERFETVSVAGSACSAWAGGPVARQPRGRQSNRNGGAAAAQVPPTNHIDDPAASLRPQGHAERVQSRLADAPSAVQYHG